MWRWLLDCFFPIICLGGCGRFDQWLCAQCVPVALHPRCYTGSAVGNPLLGSVIALGDYAQPVVQRCVHGLKYSGWCEVGVVLGVQLKPCIAINQYDWVVPVPLHRRRLRERGYNQAAMLAKQLPFPLLTSLKKTRATTPQMQLNRQDRLQNLSGVFVLDRTCAAEVKGKRCLLIDDVYSTGTTLRLCAEQLHQAGCRTIDAAVIAMNLLH